MRPHGSVADWIRGASACFKLLMAFVHIAQSPLPCQRETARWPPVPIALPSATGILQFSRHKVNENRAWEFAPSRPVHPGTVV
jgi:hypothetical protein